MMEEGAPSLTPPLFYEVDNELIIVKMREFDLNDKQVDEMMKMIARHKGVILDLRGNGGGSEKVLKKLVGGFFDRDLKIAEVKSRKKSESVMAKTRGSNAFGGRLVVLVDSRSASASEIFARLVQLEKRGNVMGDKTAGAVMRGGHFQYGLGYRGVLWDGLLPQAFYGVSITISDVVMSDGKSLERVGVTPEEVILPTGADLAAQRDPVLAQAASMLGKTLDAAKAGKLFPHLDSEPDEKKKADKTGN
ncbi:MAG TPA: S41 family peptidase [Pyrinomonadaceae bacterium]